jgi:hypothetical protein
MKIAANEPILFSIQKEPAALIIENADGEQLRFPLPAEIGRQMALTLLSIPEIAGDFNQMAEAAIVDRILQRSANLTN